MNPRQLIEFAQTQEEEVEDACRGFVCPRCHAPVHRPCEFGLMIYGPRAHTARYMVAQQAGAQANGRPLPGFAGGYLPPDPAGPIDRSKRGRAGQQED